MATPYIMPHGKGTTRGGPLQARLYDLLSPRNGKSDGSQPDKMDRKGNGEDGHPRHSWE